MKRALMLLVLFLAAAGCSSPEPPPAPPPPTQPNETETSSYSPLNMPVLFFVWVWRANPECYLDIEAILSRNWDNKNVKRLMGSSLEAYAYRVAKCKAEGLDIIEGPAPRELIGWVAGVIKDVHKFDEWIAKHQWKLFVDSAPWKR